MTSGFAVSRLAISAVDIWGEGERGAREGMEEVRGGRRERGVHDDLRGAPASDIDPLFRSGN